MASFLLGLGLGAVTLLLPVLQGVGDSQWEPAQLTTCPRPLLFYSSEGDISAVAAGVQA